MTVRIVAVTTEFLGNPVALMSARKKLMAICKQYWDFVPLSQILSAVRPYAQVLDDDGMPWEGVLAGREGKTSMELADCNQYLHIQWYRMQSGKYEINAYIS